MYECECDCALIHECMRSPFFFPALLLVFNGCGLDTLRCAMTGEPGASLFPSTFKLAEDSLAAILPPFNCWIQSTHRLKLGASVAYNKYVTCYVSSHMTNHVICSTHLQQEL